MLSIRMALALAVLASACGGDDDPVAIDADVNAPDAGPDALPEPAHVEEMTFNLLGGRFVEAELNAGPGDAVHVILSAPRAEMAWNIHGHANGETQIIIEEDDVMMVDYWFWPDSQALWYVMPGHSGSGTLDIEVRLELYGDAEWVGWL